MLSVNSSYKICGIYSIHNKETNFSYIGSSRTMYERLSQHIWKLRSNKHTNEWLQNSFNKRGEKVFEIIVLEVCTEENLKVREEFYILSTPKRYNIVDKPVGPLRLPTPTAERRLKVSIANRGQKRTDEQRRRISETHMGHVTSEETKRKQSLARLKYIEENKETIFDDLSKAGKLAAKAAYEKFLLEHPDGHKVDWTTNVCPQCNKEFKLQPHLAKRTIYCSNKCRTDAMVGRELTQEHKDKLSQAGKAFYSTDAGKKYIEQLKETQKGQRIVREIRICACDCNETFEAKVTSKKRYIFKHFKIKKQSEESKRKRSNAMKQFFETPKGLETKEKLKVSDLAGKLKQIAMKQKVKSNAN